MAVKTVMRPIPEALLLTPIPSLLIGGDFLWGRGALAPLIFEKCLGYNWKEISFFLRYKQAIYVGGIV